MNKWLVEYYSSIRATKACQTRIYCFQEFKQITLATNCNKLLISYSSRRGFQPLRTYQIYRDSFHSTLDWFNRVLKGRWLMAWVFRTRWTWYWHPILYRWHRARCSLQASHNPVKWTTIIYTATSWLFNEMIKYNRRCNATIQSRE